MSKDVTYKTGGVVILDGLGIAKGLEDGVGLEQLRLQLSLSQAESCLGYQGGAGFSLQLLLFVAMVRGSSHHCQVLDHLLGVLGFTGT